MSAAADRSTPLAEARRLAPDRVVLAVWPVLKLAAAYGDLQLARRLRSPAAVAALRWRAIDWALFLSFPAIALRLHRAEAVSTLTFAQAAATGLAMRSAAAVSTTVPYYLAPQLGWLLYATAVPLVAAQRAAGPPAADDMS